MAVVAAIKPPRSYPSVNAVHAIRARIQQASPIAAAGQFSLVLNVAKHVGTIPAGSFVLAAFAHVITVFNGTTPTLDMGTLAAAGGFIPTAAIVPGTLGFKANLATGTLLGFVANDTPVYVKFNNAGGTTTTGQVDLLLPFYPAAD